MTLRSFAGFAGSVASAVIAGLIIYGLTRPDPKPPTPPRDDPPTIHLEEIFEHSASEKINLKAGTNVKEETWVFAYIDLDDKKHSQSNMDLLIQVVFFGSNERTMRAMHSDLVPATGGKLGRCPTIPWNKEGSGRLSIVEGMAYCLKTNKGRIASFSINQLLTSWGDSATIKIQVSVITYDASFDEFD